MHSRFPQEGIEDISAQQKHRIILHIALEHLRKDHCHNRHSQKRIQHAPDISQKAPPVFQLDIPRYKLRQKIFIAEQRFYSFFHHFHFYTPVPLLFYFSIYLFDEFRIYMKGMQYP